MTMFRSLLAAAAFAAALALAVLYGKTTATVHASPAPPAALARLVPAKAPAPVAAVSFTAADGARHALASFKGRYVLLNLWAVWCAPCIKELPALAKLQAALGDKNFLVVPVDVARGTPADAAEFLKAHGAAGLPAYIDSDLALMRVFGAYGLPLSVLIDPKGREIARAVGPADWDAPDAVAWFRTATKVPLTGP
ncbi:MAG: TlpA family protein disulfide reductase [Alphaproteobacteria bacterium]|nr:TlpA family protein disulfide reductase [Alphaproteobacteria bacterium]MBV9694857.1 TlpA family protein disulfide reductase [Alphaproteobacteria bacterium]